MTDKILVIDDDRDVAAAACTRLQRFGYDVMSAEDGEQGLRLALADPPAVVLVDLRMPRMDGHTFLRRFAKSGSDAAVVVTSADGEMEDVIEVMRNGAVDYLKKPWSTADLMATIARAHEVYQKRVASPRPVEVAAPPPGTRAGTDTTAATAETSEFARALERLKKGEIVVPAVPSVVGELRDILEAPTCSSERIALLLERDQRLLTGVLRLAGSARYGGLAKTTDVRQVLGRIGLHEVRDLVETTWINGCFASKDPRAQKLIVQIWRSSLARAVAVRALARAAHLDGSAAYLGALLADVGACFLLWIAAEKTTAGDPALLLPMIHEHHVPIGSQLVRGWGYMTPIVQGMVHGHHNVLGKSPDRYLALLAIATEMAHSLGYEDVTHQHVPAEDVVERAAGALGLDAAKRAKIREQVALDCEAALLALG